MEEQIPVPVEQDQEPEEEEDENIEARAVIVRRTNGQSSIIFDPKYPGTIDNIISTLSDLKDELLVKKVMDRLSEKLMR